jgi:hypothetical protein
MNTFLIMGVVILIIVMIVSVILAIKESKKGGEAITVWTIVSRALSNPLKLFALAASLILLGASLTLSATLADTLHLRMQEYNMVDINYTMLLIIQIVGTLGAYLAPLFLMMMWDDTLVRPTYDAKAAALIKLDKFNYGVLGVTVLTIILLGVGNYFEYVNTAATVAGSCFLAVLGVSIISIVYCFIKRGANYEEIFAFMSSVMIAGAVYILDFHWNELLTYSLAISDLDINMDEMEYAKAVNMARINLDNRTFSTLAMIGVDIFASAIGLVTGDLKAVLQALRFDNDTKLNDALMSIQNGPTPNPTPPTPPNPPTPPTPPNVAPPIVITP